MFPKNGDLADLAIRVDKQMITELAMCGSLLRYSQLLQLSGRFYWRYDISGSSSMDWPPYIIHTIYQRII